MEKFNEILDAFLVEMENNPTKEIGDVIKDVAKDKKISEAGLAQIDESFYCLDDLSKKVSEIQGRKNKTREEWLSDFVESRLAKIPRLSDKQKTKIISAILAQLQKSVDDLTHHPTQTTPSNDTYLR